MPGRAHSSPRMRYCGGDGDAERERGEAATASGIGAAERTAAGCKNGGYSYSINESNLDKTSLGKINELVSNYSLYGTCPGLSFEYRL